MAGTEISHPSFLQKMTGELKEIKNKVTTKITRTMASARQAILHVEKRGGSVKAAVHKVSHGDAAGGARLEIQTAAISKGANHPRDVKTTP